MSTTAARIPTSFRFQSSLLEELKEKAKASNRSLNNYVE
ncbi:toxin-antitoxin system protein, partial [Prevotella copri]|nr:toxin-antitoxin system protein [Segatella copri]